MTNFFDKFDGTQGNNYFDRLDPPSAGGPSLGQPAANELAQVLAGGAPSASPSPISRPAPAEPPKPDPFANEGIADLLARRGQQFVRGVATVPASVPESAAILGQSVQQTVKDMPANASAAQLEQIAEMDRMIADPRLPEMGRSQIIRRRSNLIEGLARLAPEAAQMKQREIIPADQRPLFKYGEKIRKGAEDVVGAPDPRDKGFFAQAAEGAGNMAGIVAISALTGGLGGGGTAMTTAGAGIGASMNSADLYKEAKAAGASEEDALFSAKLGGIIGTTEIIPIGRALKFLPEAIRKKASKTMYARLRAIGEGAAEEGAQEYLATVANNLVAANVFDENREWSDGALEAAAVGAFLGGAIGGAGSFRGGSDDAPSTGATEPSPTAPAAPTAPTAPVVADVAPTAPVAPVAPSAPAAPIAPNATPAAQEVPAPPVDISPPSPVLQPGEVLMQSNVGPDGAALPTPVDGAFNETTGQWRPLAAPIAPVPKSPMQDPANELYALLSEANEFSPAPTTAPANPLGSAPTPTLKPKLKKPTALDPARPISAPVVSILKGLGGIDPTSTIAGDLRSAGIDQRRFPGLYKKGGLKGLDNIVADEVPAAQEIIKSIPKEEPGGGYLDPQDVFDALVEEAAGTPRRTDLQWQKVKEQNQRAQETGFLPPQGEVDPVIEVDDRISVLPIEIDLSTPSERAKTIENSVAQYFDEIGFDQDGFTPYERMRIYADLDARGGPVEDVIDWMISQEIEYVGSDPNEDFEPAPFPPFGEIEEVASGRLQEAGTVERSDIEGQEGRVTDNGPPEETGRPESLVPTEPQRTGTQDGGLTDLTQDGPQAVMPGFEQIPDRERAERQQQRPMRGGDASMPEGGLFDDQAGANGNFFDRFDQADLQQVESKLQGDQSSIDGDAADPQPAFIVNENIQDRKQMFSVAPEGDGQWSARYSININGQNSISARTKPYNSVEQARARGVEEVSEFIAGAVNDGMSVKTKAAAKQIQKMMAKVSLENLKPSEDGASASDNRALTTATPPPLSGSTTGEMASLEGAIPQPQQKLMAKYRGTLAGDAFAELDEVYRRAVRMMNTEADTTIAEARAMSEVEREDAGVAGYIIQFDEILDQTDKLLSAAKSDRDGNGSKTYREFQNTRDLVDRFEAFGYPPLDDGEGVNRYDAAPKYDPSTPIVEMEDEKLFPAPTDLERVVLKKPAAEPIPSQISLSEAEKIVQSWKDEAKRQARTGENADKLVISLFDYTGQWSQPFVDAGYNVVRYDSKLGDDILTSPIDERIREFIQSGKTIYGVMAACPCTTFTGSGARWWESRHDVEDPAMLAKVFGEQALASGAKSAVEYNLMLLERTKELIKIANPSGFHVLENPSGRIKRLGNMPDPRLSFDPHHFGDPYTKRTHLWGDFNAHLPKANVDPTDGSKIQSQLRGTDPLQKEHRSITPEGFSYAFFMANSDATVEKSATKKITGAEALQQALDEEFGIETGATTTGLRPGGTTDIEKAASDADPNPTDGQKEAGNYKMGHVTFQGLDLTIENAKGSERSGTDANGKDWSVTMPAHYGYIKRTNGADGDHVDVYIGDNPDAGDVFVVDQMDADTGKFDEHKVILGSKDRADAMGIYESGFSDGRSSERLGGVTRMTVDGFKQWLDTGDQKKPIKAVEATSAASSIASAAGNTARGLDEAVKGLTELFSTKNRLSSGFTFDEDTYQAAKPHFQAALSHFAQAGSDISDAAKALVRHLKDTAGWDRSMFEAQQPYLARFLDEFAGDISKPETPTKGDQNEFNEPNADSKSGDEQPKSKRVQEDQSAGRKENRTTSEAPGQSGDGSARIDADNGQVAKPGTTGKGRTGDTTRSESGSRTDQGRPGRSVRRSDNFRIAKGSINDTRGDKTRAKDSVEAIRILKRLELEGRRATPDEQLALSLYAGGGSLAPAIKGSDGRVRNGYEALAKEIDDLTSPEEQATMARSTQYAFYTSENVVRSMWEAVTRMGFNGGKVFEPGMGIGHFAGMAPEKIANKMTYRGLEMDKITTRIARQLYPDHRVINGDFSKVNQAKSFYDLVIGNPPFGSIEISDPKYPQKFLIHDYFFAKSIDSVRPGGLLAFVTSEGTMNKLDDKARRYISERADLLGAIRLPNNAFAGSSGTQVTTDIIFLKRREDGAEVGGEPFVNSTPIELPDADGGTAEFNVNEYFQNHPEMILGSQGGFGTMRFANQYAVTSNGDLGDQLAEAVKRLPADVFEKPSPLKSENISGSIDEDVSETKPGSFYLKDGNLMQFDGVTGRELTVKSKGKPGTVSTKDFELIKGLTRIKQAMRDTISADLSGDSSKAKSTRAQLNKFYDAFVKENGPINLQKVSYSKARAPTVERARAEAREAAISSGEVWDEGSFDPSEMLDRKDKEGNANPASFTEIAKERSKVIDRLGSSYSHGSFDPDNVPDVEQVRRINMRPYMVDPEVWRLAALEHYDATSGTATKSKLFTEPTVSGTVEAKIETPSDALNVSLAKFNKVDIEFISDQLGIDPDTVLDVLPGQIFFDPAEKIHVIKDTYLSGNIREKLDIARKAAENDPSLFENVSALEKALPAEKTQFDITARPGMGWISPKFHEDFATSLGIPGLQVARTEVGGRWKVKGGNIHSTEASVKWGTTKLPFPKLFEALLNRTPIKITKKITDGEKTRDVFDEPESKKAEEKGAEVVEAFENWIWSDDGRKERLLEEYNVKFNSHVAPKFDGSYLTTPGIAAGWKWRPHQQDVIARTLQTGNTYLAHAVGAGKTSEMIASAMEMRRLGLARKPMITVPNHMLGQFTAEFYDHYPMANLAIADDYRFHTDRRREFIADISANDYDAVIITHSAFEKIPVSPEFTDQFVAKEVARFETAMKAAKHDGDRITVKSMEMIKERMENRLLSKVGKVKDDQLTWEEVGVDALFVDEAHLFRKLDFATQLGNTKGITPQGSQAAWDLYMKTRWLEQINPGRGIYFASGTPITNTMAEAFTISRFMQGNALEERGLADFDSWAQNYGSTSTDFEPDASGNYKPVTRFSQFVNAGDLSMMLRQVMDVVISEDLAKYVVRPAYETGGRIQVVVDRTDEVADYQQSLSARMKEIEKRTGPPKKGDDNILVVTGDGIASATDMRLVLNSATGEGSKLSKLAKNVYEIWERTKDHPFHAVDHENMKYNDEPAFTGPASQMVFADIQRRGGKTRFDTHVFIRDYLLERGVPAKEIALFREYKTTVAKARLFNEVNEGKVRVLIGSARQMGTGVNAQKRLYAEHNLDPHWFPAIDGQRVGRIDRQGNMNRQIGVYDYATHGTYDSTMWQMMGRKAGFIEDFLRGDPKLNQMEDIGSASVYDQIAGMTTPDPRVLQLKEIKAKVKKLERRRANKESEKRSMASKLDDAKTSIKRSKHRLDLWKPLLDSHVDLRGDGFVATVGSSVFKKRVEFGEALAAAADKVADAAKAGAVKIGEAAGFDINAEWRKASMDGASYNTADVFVRFSPELEEEFPIHTNPSDTAKALTSLINAIPSKVDAYQDRILEVEAEISRIKALQSAFVEFQEQGELDETRKASEALEGELMREAERALAEKSGKTPRPDDVRDMRGKPLKWSDIADEGDLRARLDKAGLRRVKLTWGESRPGVVASTRRKSGDVGIFLNPALATDWALDHETIHALKMMGLFTPAEWSVLEDRSRNSWMRQYSISKRYADLDADARLEEGIAEAFAAAASRRGKPTGKIKTSFNKIARFLKAVQQWLKGNGFTSAEDIFESIQNGGFKNRDVTAPRSRMSVERHLRAAPGGAFHIPDRTITSAYRETTGTLSAIRAGMSAEALIGSFDRARTALQDKMLPQLRAQQKIEEVTGAKLSDEMNVYQAEETYSGRTGFRLSVLDQEWIEPALTLIAESENLTTENVGEYLYALHAKERNQHIASINMDMPDGGSGMMTEEAARIISEMESSTDADTAKRIARMIQDLRQKTIEDRVEYGLLSEAQGRAWSAKYEWYVPLKGFAETDGADGSLDISGIGRGNNVSGAETRRAMGRQSEAFNPLIAAISQSQEVVIRGEKNRVGQSLYRLAEEFGNPDLFSVKKVQNKRYFNQSTGLVDTYAQNPLTYPQAKDELALKIDGKEHRIIIHDPRILEAITQIGAERLGSLTSISRSLTQFLSMMNTMFSPSFVAVNAIRDFLTAHIQVAPMAGAEAGAIMKDVRKNYLSALRGAYGGLKGKRDTEWQRNYAEFAAAGGKIEFFKIETPEEMNRTLERRVRIMTKEASVSDKVVSWQQSMIFAKVEQINLAVDNAMRLAAFKSAIDRGWTPAKAAQLSKNLTVNFNRRGSLGSAINAYIMFYNAGMQGFHMLALAMKNKKARRMIYAIAALGVLEDQIMSAISEEDDDGELAYDKLRPYQRSMNFIGMMPGGGDGTLMPLPYGYNIFAYFGKQGSRVSRGGVTFDQAVTESIPEIFNSVSPPIVPTLYEPYRTWTQNKDWLGRPIRPEYPFSDHGPKSERAYPGTSALSSAVASSLNRISGGDSFHAGAIDVAPGYIDHFAGWISGGVGRLAGDVLKAGETIFLEGEVPEWRHVPVIDRFGYSTGLWLDKSAYYNRREIVKESMWVYKNGGPAALSENDLKMMKISPILKASEKVMRAIRKDRKKIYSRDLPITKMRPLLQALEAREKKAVDRFNRAFVEAR